MIRNKVLAPRRGFYEAMDAAQHLVRLWLIAVELADRTMLSLGREIADCRSSPAVRGDPDAVLIVEFAEEDQAENLAPETAWRADGRSRLGYPAQMGGGRDHGAGVADRDRGFSRRGPHVMMSMKQEGKLVSSSRTARCRCRISPTIPSGSTPSLQARTSGTMYAHARRLPACARC